MISTPSDEGNGVLYRVEEGRGNTVMMSNEEDQFNPFASSNTMTKASASSSFISLNTPRTPPPRTEDRMPAIMMNSSSSSSSLVLIKRSWHDYCNPAAWLSFMVVFIVFVAISGACLMYPFFYVRDFSQNTIVENRSITLKPYYPSFWYFIKNYSPPFVQATRKFKFQPTLASCCTRLRRMRFDWPASNATTMDLYFVWRTANVKTQNVVVNYWYRLEYEDHREVRSFTFALLCVGVFIISASTVVLYRSTLTTIFSLVFRSVKDLLLLPLTENRQRYTRTSNDGTEIEVNPNKGADIVFENLSYVSFNQKTILHPISGILKAGRFTALMGQSGSGKSTFVNTLANRAFHGIQSGRVLINGVEVTGTTNNLVGFVTQDDVMAPHMTVRETLEFSLRFRKGMQRNAREKIDSVLKRLNLTRVQHSNTAVISGGEKRRTSIGIELVADMPIYILDEPTSGLDSESALTLCEILRTLAEENNSNILCVIHQPSCEILEQFHDIMLFSDGQLLFHSPVSHVLEALREHIPAKQMRCNPSDEILRTLITPQGKPIVEAIVKKQDPASMELNRNLTLNWKDMKTAPFFIHFIVCLVRALKQFCRDWKNLVFEVLVSFVVGLLIGILFHGLEFIGPRPKHDYKNCPPSLRAICMSPQSDTVVAYASFLVLAVSLIAIMRGLRVFGFEIENFKRESFAGLNSWMFSTWIHFVFFFEPAIAQLAAALVVVVFYSLAGNNPTLPEIEKLAFPLSYSHIFTYFRYIKGLVYMHELDTRRKEQSISEALKMNGYEYESLFFYYYALLFWLVAFRYIAIYYVVVRVMVPSDDDREINHKTQEQSSRKLSSRISQLYPLRVDLKSSYGFLIASKHIDTEDEDNYITFSTSMSTTGDHYCLCLSWEQSSSASKGQEDSILMADLRIIEGKLKPKPEKVDVLGKIEDLLATIKTKLDHIKEEQSYFLRREERFRYTSESTLERSFYLCVGKGIALLICFVWQMRSLHNYWKLKKVI
ncbi:hypothetical protein C9374_004139 [Naegleria lovaniensis]|uniref:ABC transporter domain-containing protein n=1 Tax=Naegleria lovaniensis TaxID=51637 RepID=A0AA88GS53_NAELO|nr:uncharacterized protein C9374_004139 [Naegleria lovaniensis]KAG2383468.1 hypothetical protein C9374_004139 [Naegleria lovaniensis]